MRLFLLSLLMTSCSVATLVIGKLDYFITKEISTTLDLYYRQNEQLEKDVEKWLNHLQPVAEQFLTKFKTYQRKVKADDINKVMIEKEAKDIITLYKQVVRSIAPILGKYMATLNEAQQKHLFKKIEEKTKDFAERVEKKKIKHSYERYQNYFGKLTNEQKQLFKDKKEYFFSNRQERLDLRYDFAEKLRKAFRQKKDADAFSKLIEDYLTSGLKSKNIQVHTSILFKFLQGLTSSQKEKFDEKMDLFIKVTQKFLETTY